MKKLIFSALALDDNKGTQKNSSRLFSFLYGPETYIQNAFVCLKSAKNCNQDCDVALICNFFLPSYYQELYQKESITVFKIPFDQYLIPADYRWALAFFKLKALEYSLTLPYESFMMVDCDCLFLRSCDEIFYEAESCQLLLSCVLYGAESEMRKRICVDYSRYSSSPQLKMIDQIGGEFFVGTKAGLSEFAKKCGHYFSLYEKGGFQFQAAGDEYIESMAAADLKFNIANQYIDRCWTRSNCYYASSRYLNPCCKILHLLTEKGLGLKYLYYYYMHTHRFPKISRMASICNLPPNNGKKINFLILIFYLKLFLLKVVLKRSC